MLVLINPSRKGLAFVPPSGERLGEFVSDRYCWLSVSIQDLNRTYGASGLVLGRVLRVDSSDEADVAAVPLMTSEAGWGDLKGNHFDSFEQADR